VAHIIVVNHALLLSDMLVSNRVLPEYHHLIVDEAHHLEARATEQLGFETHRDQADSLLASLYQQSSSGPPRGFLASIPEHFQGSLVPAGVQKQIREDLVKLQGQVEEARGSAGRLLDTLQVFLNDVAPPARRSRNAYDLHVELTSGMRVQPAWSEIEILTDDLDQVLLKVEKGLQGVHTGFDDLEDQEVLDYDDLVQDVWSRLEHVRALREQLYAILNDPQPDSIYWFRIGARDGQVSLHSAPLHVGPLLAQQLFPDLETLVLSSATLSTAKEFGYIRERLSLQDADELRVDSPFDYAGSTLLCLPTDMPEPSQPSYQDAVAKSMLDLCLATEGRALLLFTSHRQLRETYYSIARRLEEADIAVF